MTARDVVRYEALPALVECAPMTSERLLSVSEAARLANVTRRGILAAIEANKLKAERVGRYWVIRRDDLLEWMLYGRKMGRPRKTTP